MSTPVVPDSVTDLRDLIRGLNIPGLGENVFGRFPDALTFPAARVYRIGGGFDPGTEGAFDQPRFVVEVVAGDATERNATDLIARTIASLLHQLPGGTVQGGTRFGDISVTQILPIPEPDSTQIRTLLELSAFCTPA